MGLIDGRTLSHDALETIRRLAVKRVALGEAPTDVIKSYGFCRTTIYKWLRVAESGGEDALASTPATGRPRTLTAAEAQKVGKWISGKDPRQYGFDFGLWTRRIVAALIERKLGKRLSVTAVGRLLASLGITPQKPMRRFYERDAVSVAMWVEEEFPRIRAYAKAIEAQIFFLDETGIRSDATLGRTWAPRGETPIVKTYGQRQSVNAISAVNSAGAFWYETFNGTLNASRFEGLLRNFMARRKRPVILVLDGHPAHRAKSIFQYVQSLKGRLEIHFLPGYSPDLNPDEHVWAYLKGNGVKKEPLRKGESLVKRVTRDLAAIASNRKLVKSFFMLASVSYIMN
jgi:transposase